MIAASTTAAANAARLMSTTVILASMRRPGDRGKHRAARPRSGASIELLYFDGCPSYERLLPALRTLAEQHGAELRLRRVETPEAAERERFLGSPTVRVDGVDVEPAAAGRNDFGLKCRMYRSAAGLSPLPPEHWIRAALE